MSRRRSLLISLAAGVITTLIGVVWVVQNHASDMARQQFLLADIAETQVHQIDLRLSRSLVATEILAMNLRQAEGEMSNFDTEAPGIVDFIGGISNVQLAPGGIVEKIYPLAGNEAALGHNILRDDARRDEAQQAVETGELTLAGPFDLVQGGTAVIGRKPVFLPAATGNEFWGFASALIFLDDLIASTDLNSLAERGYSYTLSRIDPATNQSQIFATSNSPIQDPYVTQDLQVPNATWQLTLSDAAPTSHAGLLWGIGASIVFGFLVAALLYRVLRQPHHLRTQVANRTAELHHLAFHDPLTELANRRALTQELANDTLHADTTLWTAFLYVDLDDFKRVNDTQGHEAGDTLLKVMASRLVDVVPRTAFVARLGGDEFGVLLQDVSTPEQGESIARRVVQAIGEPVAILGRDVRVTASVGVSFLSPSSRDVNSVLRDADLALYSAKRRGKATHVVFDAAAEASNLEQLELESSLAAAPSSGQLRVHYQPIYDARTSKLAKYEALLRWDHPTLGLVSPSFFIPIAERTGSIEDLTAWMIQKASDDIASWPPSVSKVPIALNVSPLLLSTHTLHTYVQQFILERDIDTSLVQFEITESSVMADLDNSSRVLSTIAHTGIRLSLDDFGTGYSSLLLLRDLPVSEVKIDRSIITGISEDSSLQQMVTGIIGIAHGLHLSVVAEGVETQADLDWLIDADCDFVQGYLLSQPLPLADLLESRTVTIKL